jgi:rare lipoprotein A (peptidoglycan hydrolase)
LALRVRAVGIPAARTTMAGRVATVYHQVIASWYGPGGTTACGEQLGTGTLGVANKTLPCGTKVTLRFGTRVLTVPVIDRGPFVAGRDYDLTYATKVALGAGDISTIWASA